MPISLDHAQVSYSHGEEARARDFYGKALDLDDLDGLRTRLQAHGNTIELDEMPQ